MEKIFTTIGKFIGTPDRYIDNEIDPTWAETIQYFSGLFKKYGFEILLGALVIGLLELFLLN
jgi:hypothetical protein